MASAFVLGLFDTGLAVVRALGRQGIEVFGFDHRPGQPGFWSRYGRNARCPDPVAQPRELVAFLLSHAERLPARPVLYLTSDAYVEFASEHRDALAAHLLFALPARDAVASAIDKSRQYLIAAEAGVPIAATHRPASLDEVTALAPGLTYPVIVKPTVGHRWRRHYRHEKALRIENAVALVSTYREVLAAGETALVQDLVPGPNTNHCKVCAYIGADGDPLAVMCMRKIRQYPVDFGVGTLMESVDEPELMALGLRLFRAIGWRGTGSIEFKRDARDGVWRLIELNPRLWQQNGLAAACGMNFPLVQHRDLEGTPNRVSRYVVGRRWLDEFHDPLSALEHRRRGLLGAGGWAQSLRRVCSFAVFAADDPGPFVHALGLHARAAWHRARGHGARQPAWEAH